MKKYLLLLCLLPLMPLTAQADVSLDINIPGVNLHLGDQDNRGYYWDGYDWRPPQWWHEHRGGHIGDRSERGYYWDGGRWQSPPAQSGRNPFRGQPHVEQGHNQPQRSNNDRNNGHGQPNNPGGQGNQGGQSNHGGSNNKGGSNNSGGSNTNSHRGDQPVYPPQNNGHR